MNARLALLALALAGCVAPRSEPDRPPNVIFVLADDLGLGELGSFGQEKILTPHLDRLAREGMRFTRHYSGSPVCAPSRCVLLTGLHTGHAHVRANSENGGWGPDAPEGQLPLPAGTVTLGHRLQERGYRTAAVGKWGLGGPGTTGAPEHQGFDHFFGYLCQRKAHNYYPTHLWRDGEKVPLEGNPYFKAHQRIEAPLASDADYAERYAAATYAPDLMIEDALEFVRASADGPFFLLYASPIPHAGLQVPDEDLEAYPASWDPEPYLGHKGYLPHPSPRRAYAAMVSRLDREVGRLVALVEELGLTEDTLVVFSSDNGATYNGGTDSAFFGSFAGLRGRKGSVYEAGVRVPLIARWPGRVAAGSSSDHLSGFQDVLPTLVEAAGGEVPAGLDGRSFLPTLLDRPGQETAPFLYWELRGQQALRAGRWKAVRPRLGKGDLELEVYDLEADPGETRDLASERPEITRRLEALLAEARVPSPDFPVAALDGPTSDTEPPSE